MLIIVAGNAVPTSDKADILKCGAYASHPCAAQGITTGAREEPRCSCQASRKEMRCLLGGTRY